MTADEIIEFAAGLPGVAALTAHEGDGSRVSDPRELLTRAHARASRKARA